MQINHVPSGLAVDIFNDRERRLVLAVCQVEGVAESVARQHIRDARKIRRIVTYLDYADAIGA